MPGPAPRGTSRPPGDGRDRTGLAVIAATLPAIVCCAAGPAIIALFGSVALGAVAGWAAGAVALAAVVLVLLTVARRRHHGSPPATWGFEQR